MAEKPDGARKGPPAAAFPRYTPVVSFRTGFRDYFRFWRHLLIPATAYPFWSLLIIAVDIVALWGPCAFGSRENLEAAA
jgi:hypothetical protein